MKITRKYQGRIVPKGLTRKKGRVAWNKGIPMSIEQRHKLSLAKIGKKITVPRKASMTGKHHTQETKDKMRLSSLGKKCPWNIGIPHTEDAKVKMSLVQKERFLNKKNHPRWIKDRALVKVYDDRRADSLYKLWRMEVKKRDGYKCVLSDDNCRGRLEAHHVLNWINYPELRYEVNNGVTVCYYHHPRSRSLEEKTIPIFTKLLQVHYK